MWCVLYLATADVAACWSPTPILPSITVHQADNHGVESCHFSLFPWSIHSLALFHSLRLCSCLSSSLCDIYSLSAIVPGFVLCLVITHLSHLRSFIQTRLHIPMENGVGKEERSCMRLRMLYICNPINFHILWSMTDTRIDMWSLSFHRSLFRVCFSLSLKALNNRELIWFAIAFRCACASGVHCTVN